MPSARVASRLVDKATKCPATSRPPCAANQASAERAFIMVSAVVNVLDAMMNKVFSALSP